MIADAYRSGYISCLEKLAEGKERKQLSPRKIKVMGLLAGLAGGTAAHVGSAAINAKRVQKLLQMPLHKRFSPWHTRTLRKKIRANRKNRAAVTVAGAILSRDVTRALLSKEDTK